MEKFKILDIIEYEGDNQLEGDNIVVVHKHKSTDFNTHSQLIVRESQEALLFLNGQALDLFGSGKHTLHTQNIPLLNKIYRLPTGGVSPFKCEVYFINKVEQMAISWGMGGVNYPDPTNNDHEFVIGARGELSIRISDSRKLILKLVGTKHELTQGQLMSYFKVPIVTHIKTMLPRLLRQMGLSIFDVESDLAHLSEVLKEKVSEEMGDYGITLEKFWVEGIKKPETDETYIQLNKQRGQKVILINQGELDMQKADNDRRARNIEYTGEMQRRQMDIDIKRYEQEQLGFTYEEERKYNFLDKLAQNEGGGLNPRDIAIWSGNGIVDSIMNKTISESGAKEVTNPLPEQKEIKKNDMEVFRERIEKLKLLKESGFLTEAEFEQERQGLLNLIRG